jgi:hypothetical protein
MAAKRTAGREIRLMAGELGWDAMESMTCQAGDALKGHDQPQVLLDIEAVDFVTSAGIGAVLSARIAETTTADDGPASTVAMLSEVWIRRGDEWQLVSVRMVPLDAIPATLQ